MLGTVLLLACVASLGLLALVLGQGGQWHHTQIRRWLTLYSVVVAATLILGILWFLGYRRGGSPSFRDSKQASLDWIGYYTARRAPLRFTSDGGETTLKLPRLKRGESFVLTPLPANPRGATIRWSVAANVGSQPIRVQGICVNVPGRNWLLDGDVLTFQQLGVDDRSFFELQFADTRRLLRPVYSVYFNQGLLTAAGRKQYDLKEPVEIWSTEINSDITLAAMLRSLDRQRSREPEPIDWWNIPERYRRWRHPLVEDLLNADVSRGGFFARLTLFDGIVRDMLFVREEVNELDSRTGLLVADAAGWSRQMRADRISRDGSSYSLLGPPPKYESEIDGDSSVEIGSGSAPSKQRFQLPLRWSTDPIVGTVADVEGRNQPRWDLPPKPREPFVIMSSEAGVPMSGYNLDIGMRRQPFYAKAVMTIDDRFVVNDGRDARGRSAGAGKPLALEAGDRFRLGSGSSGALLRFSLATSPVLFAGLRCILIVLAIMVLTVISLRSGMITNARAETAWTVVLWLTTCLLFVRVVLTYRLAVLPPSDASGPIRALFAQSLGSSIIAFALIPLALLALRLFSRSGWADWIDDQLARIIPSTSSLTVRAVAAGALLTIWVIIVIVTGADEEIGPIRVNVMTQALGTIAIALAAGWLLQLHLRYRVVVVALWILVTIGLMVILVGDFGFMINSSAMMVVATAALVYDRYRRISRVEWALVLIAFAAISTLVFFRERLLIGVDTDTWAERVIASKESYVYYRVAATPEGRQRLLEKVGDPDDFRFDMYRRNAAHHWQMLLYASEGMSKPKGYGAAKLSRVGMSYPTSLSDSMFAVHLLPEHGFFAGWTLLLTYFMIALSLVIAAGALPDVLQHRTLALLGIAGHFIFSALYMVSTNLGQLIFTGQNIPLLSLTSRSDIAAGLLLLGLATILCHNDVQGSSRRFFDPAPWWRGLTTAVLLIALIWTGANMTRMVAVGRDKGLREPLGFPTRVMEAWKAHLPSASPNPAVQLRGDRLEPVGPLSWLEQRFIDQFNASPDKYDRDGSFYFLSFTPMGDRDVRINDRYFSIASPFRGVRRWPGVIRYGAASFPTLNVLGSDVRIHPGGSRQPESVSLTEPFDAQHEYSDRVILRLTDMRLPISVCEIALDGGRARVYPIGTRDPQRIYWEVHVDGQIPTFGQELRGGEILRIDGQRQVRRARRKFSYSLLYLGRYEPVLAATHWRNGTMQRIVQAGTLDSMVSDIGSLLDNELSRTNDPEAVMQRLPASLNLTIDMPLQQNLDVEVATAANAIYKPDLPRQREVVALSVIDAFNGDVLAASSWIANDPTDRRSWRNWNLRNHAIGSTIKPILLSTIAAGYQGSGFDVTQFAAYNQSDCAAPEDSEMRHPHCSVAGVPLEKPEWDCQSGSREMLDTRNFLVESRNFMAVTLGMLGMMSDARDWKTMLLNDVTLSQNQAQYQGTRYALSMLTPRSTAFTARDPIPVPLPGIASNSILFTTLPKLFTVTVPRALTAEQMQTKLRQDLVDYLPSLGQVDVRANYFVDDVLPDRIDLLPHDLQSTRRDLLPFFLGGGREGFWNNLRMSEAAARLGTGNKVRVHVERINAAPPNVLMPAPVGDAKWRERNLIEPLVMVGSLSTGFEATAAGLAEEIESAAPGAGYRAMFKTGTLDERDTGVFESEMLLFVVGKWNDTGFVPGQTVAGYLYLADTKVKKDGQWQRLDVAKPILRRIVNYLDTVGRVKASALVKVQAAARPQAAGRP